MSNILLKYLENRHIQHDNKEEGLPGPVITISREAGCSALDITKLVAQKIKKKHAQNWNWVDKQILQNAAKELDNNLFSVLKFLEGHSRSQLEEMLSSFTPNKFHSDIEIRRVVTNVIQSIAQEGNVVILGRGGVAIAKDISRSLHVRIFAPKDWRIENSMRRFKFSHKEAIEFINETDKRRNKLFEVLLGTNNICLDSVFDVAYNRSKLLADEIAESIVQLSAQLGLFKQ